MNRTILYNAIMNGFKTSLMMIAMLFALGLAGASDDDAEVWIDVRTENEYRRDHLDGAVNIPHSDIGQRIDELNVDKHAPIYLYCVAGVRAEIAKNTLIKMGYENVINAGGIRELRASQKASE